MIITLQKGKSETQPQSRRTTSSVATPYISKGMEGTKGTLVWHKRQTERHKRQTRKARKAKLKGRHTLATRGLAALAPLGVMMAFRYSCSRGHMSTMRSLLRSATAISSSKHTCSATRHLKKKKRKTRRGMRCLLRSATAMSSSKHTCRATRHLKKRRRSRREGINAEHEHREKGRSKHTCSASRHLKKKRRRTRRGGSRRRERLPVEES